jgi:peptidoglycan/xylan/chitin deacetylase (PgdA/CDA1 family)
LSFLEPDSGVIHQFDQYRAGGNQQPEHDSKPQALARHEERVRTRQLWTRIHSFYKRRAASVVFRRPLAIRSPYPLISFTFDDFPRSAFLAGGAILSRYGLSGTYYTSLGLMGKDGPSGLLYCGDDLRALIEQGHELGCHTFSHCHSWETERAVFENSIIQNRAALNKLIPGAEFKSLSYPISEPRPMTKRAMAKHFQCCRGGGQTLNVGRVDLNQLAAYFLEKSRENIQAVKNLIDLSQAARGWIIFATHDVSSTPSPYGCSPAFFEDVVRYAVDSGARVLPVARALEVIRSSAATG